MNCLKFKSNVLNLKKNSLFSDPRSKRHLARSAKYSARVTDPTFRNTNQKIPNKITPRPKNNVYPFNEHPLELHPI